VTAPSSLGPEYLHPILSSFVALNNLEQCSPAPSVAPAGSQPRFPARCRAIPFLVCGQQATHARRCWAGPTIACKYENNPPLPSAHGRPSLPVQRLLASLRACSGCCGAHGTRSLSISRASRCSFSSILPSCCSAASPTMAQTGHAWAPDPEHLA